MASPKKKQKKIEGYLKLQAPAGGAAPAPPLGPALGQRGINIMEFCKAFNDATKGMEAGAPVPVSVTVFADKSFEFQVKTPLTSHLLRKAAGLDKGGATPGRQSCGVISREKLREVAEIKRPDLNALSIDEAIEIVAGTARSMGLEVSE